MQETDQTIIKAVYTFTTLYISIYDSSAKEVKDIIAAVTFKHDQKKSTYIFWSGVHQRLTKMCSDNTLFKSFNGTYQ